MGNRTSSAGVDSTSYTYGAFNRLTSTTVASYTYNNNGNLTSRSGGIGDATYSWDFENRLTQVDLGDLSVSYKYDALGRRIQRSTNNGALLNFVYDGNDVILDLDGEGNVVTSYLNGPGVDNKIRQTDDENGNLYYTTDHLGSTTALVDDSGTMVQGIGYDSFGNSTETSYTRYTYTGREFDADTGLYFYRARWYDPQVGRFVSEDPIGFLGQDINFYAYVKNNPNRFRDPSGLFRCDPIVGAIIGGGIGGLGGTIGGALLGPFVGAGIGALSFGGAGTVVAGPGGTIFGGAGGAVGGAAAGEIVGPIAGGLGGAGIGGYIGYKYCSQDDTCDKTDAPPWTPNRIDPDREDECFKRCAQHLEGSRDPQSFEFTNCYKRCMGRTIP